MSESLLGERHVSLEVEAPLWKVSVQESLQRHISSSRLSGVYTGRARRWTRAFWETLARVKSPSPSFFLPLLPPPPIALHHLKLLHCFTPRPSPSCDAPHRHRPRKRKPPPPSPSRDLHWRTKTTPRLLGLTNFKKRLTLPPSHTHSCWPWTTFYNWPANTRLIVVGKNIYVSIVFLLVFFGECGFFFFFCFSSLFQIAQLRTWLILMLNNKVY